MSGDEEILDPKETPTEETPTEETPTEETPAEETPAEETPAEETPAEETPAEETPAEETPAEETPTEENAEAPAGPGLSKAAAEASPEISDETLISRLESIIFVSPEPITVRRLARILSQEGKKIRELLGVIGEHYENRGIVLQEVSGGFQFRSHPDNAKIVRHVFKMKPMRISRAALETLSIVAYRQPLTRTEVESIRGVDCGGVLKYLFEKQLVRVIGRKEEPGRPIIYGTSQTFLELFGLKALSDLPALHEFSELWEDHQQIVDEETPLVEEPEGEPEDEPEGETEDEPEEETEDEPEGETEDEPEPEEETVEEKEEE
ncbi:MAG: SMC-Scp complex subunit ScpB [Deltaproteobacteria bacterium]|nr:SMC-Scp complex subunit ScpB [Deltaproteobacteria bacterium]